jgi:hypothetical protein
MMVTSPLINIAMDKGSMCQPFDEEVTELVFGVNLDQSDSLGGVGYFFVEPMVFDCIMFGPRSNAAMLQATKSQGTNVVFMHFAVNIGDE